MEILGILIAGLIIGLLGKLVAPGDKDNTPLWLTLLCGIGGVLLGLAVYTAFGGNGSPGIDWTRWAVSVIIAAVLVVLASTLTRPKRAHTHRCPTASPWSRDPPGSRLSSVRGPQSSLSVSSTISSSARASSTSRSS